MAGSLTSYWISPQRFRRLPRTARLAVWAACVGASVGLGLVPAVIWRRSRAWQGLEGLVVELYFDTFLLIVCVAFGLAGAATSASERQHQTWDSLLVTPLGVRAIVRAKLWARVLRCAGVAALTLPFWIGWGFQALEVNGVGPMRRVVDAGFVTGRTAVYLSWVCIRIVGHALPLVAIGLAASARCRTLRTALAAVLAIETMYGLLYWAAAAIGSNVYMPMAVSWSSRPTAYAGAILAWPVAPPAWTEYPDVGWFSTHWPQDLAADALWLVLIPWLCYRYALRQCRRRMEG